jgi:hypothetical protein
VFLRRRYFLSAFCTFLFLAAQTFQAFAYRFWIPSSHGPQDDLLTYLLPIDKARAILVMITIVALIVPFVVIALRYRDRTPLASVLGVIFGTAFIGFELSQRSVDFFVVGQHWARDLASASAPQHELILQRFAAWRELVAAWYFPLLLSYLIASSAFLVATWTDRRRGWLYYLAPSAYLLNTSRLLARILSTFAGQQWLDGANGSLYFPLVFVSNTLIMIWFIVLAREPITTG